MHFNKLLGMGTKEQNQLLRIERENNRPIREMKPIKVWDIWNKETEEKTPKQDIDVVQDNIKRKIRQSENNIKKNIENNM